jgi:hypothetical protein
MRQKSVHLVRRLGSTATSYKSSSIQGLAVQNHERPCPRGDVTAVSCRYLSAVPQPAAEQPVKPFKGQTPSIIRRNLNSELRRRNKAVLCFVYLIEKLEFKEEIQIRMLSDSFLNIYL